MLRSPHTATLMIALVLTAAAALPGQPGYCEWNDGFDQGCCTLPQPNLPAFPAATISGAWARLGDCGVPDPQLSATTVFGPASMFLCDYATVTIQANVPGMGMVNGVLFAKYARSWAEVTPYSPVGAYMTWRFLVNGDLEILPYSPAIDSDVPPVVYYGAGWRVHMIGHLDYVCTPAGTPVLAAYSLSHLPACIQFSAFSTTPNAGLAASTQSFHLVGPAPFVFTNAIAEPQGLVAGDSARESRASWSPFFYQCLSEARVGGGYLTTVSDSCLCAAPSPVGPRPFRNQTLTVDVCCGGPLYTIHNIPQPGTVVPTGLFAQSLGYWPAGYGNIPGRKDLLFYGGVLNWRFLCHPAWLETARVFSGVATRGHQGMAPSVSPASCPSVSGIPMGTFIDLHGMLPVVYAPAITTGFGSVFGSDSVLSLNTIN